jgi:long-chain acyl-CoA synthetase
MTENLGEFILAPARQFGDRVSLQARRGDSVTRHSYREVVERARRFAGWLEARGVVPGDRLAVWSPNMPEYVALYFGAWLAGAVVVPIDVRTRPEVVQRFVAATMPRIGFRSREVAGELGSPVEATFTLEHLFRLVDQSPPLTSLPRVGPDSPCEIAFTSGTTGEPKGVILTHGNFLAELQGLEVAFPLKPSYRALSVLPLSHALEQVINLLLPYRFGVPITYLPRLSPDEIAMAMRAERITCFVAVPELLRLMLRGIERQVRRQGGWRRWRAAHRIAGRLPFPLRRLLFHQVHQALGGGLLFLGSGGAPLDLKLASAWEHMGIHILEGYGLTETTAAATINNWAAKRLGTVGRPIPGVEVRVAEDGEILIRGKTVSPGYYNNPALTARSIVGGWFHTGDIGVIDASGFLHITGRGAFKIVLPSGQNVYPEDLEQLLNRHPAVRDSCVVGLPHNGGESVHAVLLVSDPDDARRVVRAINRGVAPYQRIRGYTVWPEDDFPLKIDRRQVRSAVRHGTEGEAIRATPA